MKTQIVATLRNKGVGDSKKEISREFEFAEGALFF